MSENKLFVIVIVIFHGGHTPSKVLNYIYICLQPILSMTCVILLTMCKLVLFLLLSLKSLTFPTTGCVVYCWWRVALLQKLTLETYILSPDTKCSFHLQTGYSCTIQICTINT